MNRLKELREERGWSMRDAAKFLDKPYTTYVNHEKQYRELDSEDLRHYADKYKVSIDYLVGRSEIKNPVTQGDGKANTYIQKLLEAVPDLTEQQAKFLLPQVIGLISAQNTQDSPK